MYSLFGRLHFSPPLKLKILGYSQIRNRTLRLEGILDIILTLPFTEMAPGALDPGRPGLPTQQNQS